MNYFEVNNSWECRAAIASYRLCILGWRSLSMPLLTIGIAEGGLGVLLPSIVSRYNLTPATFTLLFVQSN
ncbi:MAG: hypothetical protein V7L20_07500 [Nostoc sp.]|uniref:hypothetical protein n=1 Tax=Nostoc sp. TaxID=1180 RepID=UPI002FF46F00